MQSKFDHIHNTIVKKIDVFYKLSGDRNSKIATVNRLYEDLVKLYMQSTPDFLLNEWLDDDKYALHIEDLEYVSTREHAEDCIMQMMINRRQMPEQRFFEKFLLTDKKV